MLKELVDLLTCRELDPKEVATLVAEIDGAAEDPDLEWMGDASPEELMQTALVFKLMEYIAVGDKVDELHEQINDFFGVPLGDYPRHADGREFLPEEYFAWLDPILAQRGKDGSGYELLLLDDSFSDELNAIVVRRPDTARVLEIAKKLELAIQPSTSRSTANRRVM